MTIITEVHEVYRIAKFDSYLQNLKFCWSAIRPPVYLFVRLN